MTALLSLPHVSRAALTYERRVPSALRARAAAQIRQAVAAGRISPTRLQAALAQGDVGLAELMSEHHVLRGNVQILPDERTQGQFAQQTTLQLIDWARHLRAAGRLSNDTLATLTPATASEGLVRACVAGSAPRLQGLLPPLANSPGHRYFGISTSFVERLGSYRYANSDVAADQEAEPSIWLEPQVLPMVELPTLSREDDRTALLSAVEAIARADHFGLWSPPRHVPYLLDAWTTELLLDAGHEAKKDAQGRPIFTAETCEHFAEEIGLELDDDISVTCASLAAHYTFLHQLEKSTYWKSRSQPLRAWLASRAGSPEHALVTRLLAIAAHLDACQRSPDLDIEATGDACTLMIAPTLPRELYLFDYAAENYGASETPQIEIRVKNGRQNPSAFWAAHDRVVMAASLVTDAANALTAYENRSQPR